VQMLNFGFATPKRHTLARNRLLCDVRGYV